MQNALQIGYRFFDTAQMYRNEKELGIAIAWAMQILKDSSLPTKESRSFATHSTKHLDSNITPTSSPHRQSVHMESSEVSSNDLSRPLQRNDLFITTKISSSMPYKKARQSIEGSLQNLGLEYVDLLVIHAPYANAKEMYKACEEAYRKGLIRAIGISNFYGKFLEDFLDSVRVKPVLNEAYHKGLIHAIGISNFYGRFLEDFSDSVRVKPVLNQVQALIFFQQNDLKKFLESKNIHLQAWSPLACGRNGKYTLASVESFSLWEKWHFYK